MFEDLSIVIIDISVMGVDEIVKLKFFDCWCNGDKDLWVKIVNMMKLCMVLCLFKWEIEVGNVGMNFKVIVIEVV